MQRKGEGIHAAITVKCSNSCRRFMHFKMPKSKKILLLRKSEEDEWRDFVMFDLAEVLEGSLAEAAGAPGLERCDRMTTTRSHLL